MTNLPLEFPCKRCTVTGDVDERLDVQATTSALVLRQPCQVCGAMHEARVPIVTTKNPDGTFTSAVQDAGAVEFNLV